ncbi:hypothetical protein [Luteimicrobium sp. DT211]|uniref:hypothetical protein n=1 Tax=Luteimicrobium sp. DT211 TaxID=3393412 RepID=UPI003CE68F10
MSAVATAWRAIRRDETAREALDAATRARRQATVVAAVAATVPTIMAAEGMLSLAVDLLGFPVYVAVGLASFLELALIASALLARAAAMAGRPGGADAVAVWVVSATSGLLAGLHELVATRPDGSTSWTTDPGSFLAAAVRFVAPLVAAWLWERVLRAARAEQAERTLAEVRRDRRYLAVSREALALRRLRDAGKDEGRRRRRSWRRLDRSYLAALRTSPPGPTLAEVLAAVGQIDHLPAATIVDPLSGVRTVAVSGARREGSGVRPEMSGQQVSGLRVSREVSGRPGTGVSDDVEQVSGRGRAAAAREASERVTSPVASQVSDGSDMLAAAVEVVRADPEMSGAALAEALTKRGRAVSARSGQRWRAKAMAALTAGA